VDGMVVLVFAAHVSNFDWESAGIGDFWRFHLEDVSSREVIDIAAK
jgi:hypothetical protein